MPEEIYVPVEAEYTYNHLVVKPFVVITVQATAILITIASTGCIQRDITEEIYVPVEAEYTYNHPCAMFNQADFDRVKKSLDVLKVCTQYTL